MSLYTCYVRDKFGGSRFIVGTSKKAVEKLIKNANWIDKNWGQTKIEKTKYNVVFS